MPPCATFRRSVAGMQRPRPHVVFLALLGTFLVLGLIASAFVPPRPPSAPDYRQAAAVNEGLIMMGAMEKAGAITREDCENHEVFIDPAFWRMAKYHTRQGILTGLSMACFGKSGFRQVRLRDAYSGRDLASVGPGGGVTIQE